MTELTERERKILALIDGPMTNREIAEQLQLSEQEIGIIIERIKQKTGLQSREELEQLGSSMIKDELP